MILNTGDVPNIYESDEKAEITEQVILFFILQLRFLTDCGLENVYVFIRGFKTRRNQSCH